MEATAALLAALTACVETDVDDVVPGEDDVVAPRGGVVSELKRSLPRLIGEEQRSPWPGGRRIGLAHADLVGEHHTGLIGQDPQDGVGGARLPVGVLRGCPAAVARLMLGFSGHTSSAPPPRRYGTSGRPSFCYLAGFCPHRSAQAPSNQLIRPDDALLPLARRRGRRLIQAGQPRGQHLIGLHSDGYCHDRMSGRRQPDRRICGAAIACLEGGADRAWPTGLSERIAGWSIPLVWMGLRSDHADDEDWEQRGRAAGHSPCRR